MSHRDRAVSNVVAFILVFALITTSIGIVSTVGFSTLTDLQQSEQARTSGALVRTIGAGIDEVAAGERPAYRNSIQLGEATLSVVNRTTVRVDVEGTAFDRTYYPRALTYQSNDRNTTYVAGLLARGGERRPAVALGDPAIRCAADGDRASVTLVELVTDGGQAVGGGPVTVDARATNQTAGNNLTRLRYPNRTLDASAATGVNVTVDGPWANGWDESLTDRGFTAAGGGSYTCSADEVFVRVVTVRVELLI